MLSVFILFFRYILFSFNTSKDRLESSAVLERNAGGQDGIK